VVTPVDTTLGLSNWPRLHGAPAAAPDGRTIAFSVAREDTTALFIQPLDRFEQRVVAGGRAPFFSPDGRWIGYLRGGVVWKVGLDGGEPTRLGAVYPDQFSVKLNGAGVWHPNGRIYFSITDGVLSIPASGGLPTPLSVTVGGARPSNPRLLGLTPDGRFLVAAEVAGAARLGIVGPAGGELGLLPADLHSPAGFAGDVFVFTRERQGYAAWLDLRRLRLEGEAVAITDVPLSAGVPSGPTIAWFDARSARRLQPVWVTRAGVATPVATLPTADYRWPRLSPDGRRIALNTGGTAAVEVVDVSTGTRVALAALGGRTEPVWLHDGRVLTSLEASGKYGLMAEMGDGSRAADTVLALSAQDAWPTDASRDDGLVFFYGVAEGDVSVLDTRTKAVRHVMRAGEQRGARLSPYGRWLAMESRDAERGNVIVLPWPALDAQYVVSPNGGTEPLWSRDGRELFFRSGNRVLAVPVSAARTWAASPAVELFRGPYAADNWGDQSWDIGPDGRFLLLRYTGESRLRIQVIENWATELRQKLAAGRR
jgi:serine/threonine-protein kinase